MLQNMQGGSILRIQHQRPMFQRCHNDVPKDDEPTKGCRRATHGVTLRTTVLTTRHLKVSPSCPAGPHQPNTCVLDALADTASFGGITPSCYRQSVFATELCCDIIVRIFTVKIIYLGPTMAAGGGQWDNARQRP